MVKNVLKKLTNVFLDSLYPEKITCLNCNDELSKEDFLCVRCKNNFVDIKKSCKKCGSPLVNSQTDYCDNCKGKKRLFDRAISPFEYTGTPQALIYKLKYNREKYVAKVFAKSLMETFLDANFGNINIVTCIPLNPKRQKERGFNQAEVIAHEFVKELEKQTGTKIEEKYDVVRRVKDTKTQTSLNILERKENLKGAFELNCKRGEIKNKNILIVDDIFTTGATMEEFASELKKFSPDKIFCLTVCHTSLNRNKNN